MIPKFNSISKYYNLNNNNSMIKRSWFSISKCFQAKIFYSITKPFSNDSFYNWDDP